MQKPQKKTPLQSVWEKDNFTISFIHEKHNHIPIDQKYIMQHDFSTCSLCLYCPLFASHNYANH